MEYIPPQDTLAERSVLGACLLSEEYLNEVVDVLVPDDFYDTNNRIAYRICVEIFTAGKPVDLITFQEEATNQKVYGRLGGQPFLAELLNDTIPAHTSYHVKRIKELALRRRIIEASNNITASALDTAQTIEDTMRAVEKEVFEITQGRVASDTKDVQNLIKPTLMTIDEERKGLRKNRGFFTRFKDLDAIIPGFQPRTLNIIAARPSMGKTALALNIAQFGGNYSGQRAVLFFSLEMPTEQLIRRMLSAQTYNIKQSVTLSSILTGTVSDKEFSQLEIAGQELRKTKKC